MISMFEDTKTSTVKIGFLFREWFNLLLRPNRFFSRIRLGEIITWIFPMILLSLASILQSIGQGIAINRLNQAQPIGLSLFLTTLFNLAAIWITWLWISGILSSFLILAGIRFPKTQPRMVTAWIMSPLAIRYVVRLVYTLITGLPIKTPGLSGFLDQTTGFISIFIGQVLGQIDLYFFWQVVLLWIGIKYIPSISPAQRKMGFLITIINLLTLFSLIKTFSTFVQNL